MNETNALPLYSWSFEASFYQGGQPIVELAGSDVRAQDETELYEKLKSHGQMNWGLGTTVILESSKRDRRV